MKPTVLIVEDHDVMRATLRDWLGSALPDCLLLEAGSGEEAINLVRTHMPPVVLMDIGLPRMNGIETTRWIKALAPEVQVVMLTIHEASVYQRDAEAAGASGYVLKRKMHSDLVPVVAELLKNGKNGEVRSEK